MCYGYIKTPTQLLSSKFCEVFKNTCFVKHLQKTASVYCRANINLDKSLLVPDLLLIKFA